MEPTHLPSSNILDLSRLRPELQQRLNNLADEPEVPLQRLIRRASLPATISCAKSSPTAAAYNCLATGPAPAVLLSRSHQSVKPDFSIFWNMLACRFIIRVGQLINLQSDPRREARPKRYQQMGFGLIISIYLPQHFQQFLGLDLCNFQTAVIGRTCNTVHWSLGFAKTVSPDADIFRSARAGSIENIKHLFSLGKASPKDTTKFGTTLLHSASKSGNIELVRLLIQEGADVNAQDEDGESPLHGAMARSDNYTIVRTLIENGADLSSKAVDGKTPFHNIFNDTIGHVLMKDDWLENMSPDSEGMSITHFLAWSSTSTPEIFQRGHLYDDADLLAADSFGKNCLHFAASRGNLGVLSYLLKQVSSEDVEKKDIHGRTPLHYAVESSRAARVIDTLVGRGCNIRAVDDTGRTAIHWAARRNNFEAVKKLVALVDEGTLLLSDRNGRTPSMEVSQRRAPDLYKYLRDLELSHELRSADQSTITQLRNVRANPDIGFDFPHVMGFFGILILIFLMFLGISD